MTTPTVDMAALKTRLKATWMAGDFGLIAKSYEPGAAQFVERLQFTRGTRVLDAACGTGNLTIPAARTGAIVTGVDIAPNLLDQARARAGKESLTIQFDEGDAEQLPYADASFDAVISMFGVMFAPRPELVSAELLRVTRPGGTIALANWTPGGFIGQMFKLMAGHVPPPAGMASPIKWGDEATVRERLEAGTSALRCTPRMITFIFPFVGADLVEFWRMYYGPTNKAFAALEADREKQAALRRDLEAFWTRHNEATDSTTRLTSEYLEIVATRAS